MKNLAIVKKIPNNVTILQLHKNKKSKNDLELYKTLTKINSSFLIDCTNAERGNFLTTNKFNSIYFIPLKILSFTQIEFENIYTIAKLIGAEKNITSFKKNVLKNKLVILNKVNKKYTIVHLQNQFESSFKLVYSEIYKLFSLALERVDKKKRVSIHYYLLYFFLLNQWTSLNVGNRNSQNFQLETILTNAGLSNLYKQNNYNRAYDFIETGLKILKVIDFIESYTINKIKKIVVIKKNDSNEFFRVKTSQRQKRKS